MPPSRTKSKRQGVKRGPYKKWLLTAAIPRTSLTASDEQFFMSNEHAPTERPAETNLTTQPLLPQIIGESASDIVAENLPNTTVPVSQDETNDGDFNIDALDASILSVGSALLGGDESILTEDLDIDLDENASSAASAPGKVKEHQGSKIPLNFEMFQKYNLGESVCPSSNLSVFEVLLMAVHFMLRFGLCYAALESLLKMICLIVGNSFLPKTRHVVEKIFSGDINFIYHFYCSDCKAYIGTESECEIGKISECPNTFCAKPFSVEKKNGGHYFITIPLSCQIQQLLEEPGISEKIINTATREVNPAYLSDVFDGLIYKKLVKDEVLIPGKDFTITVNSDGSPVFKSRKNSLWPIQFRINELIREERFSPRRTLLGGLWFGSSEPCMSTFFAPFLAESNNLSKEGLRWTDPETGQEKHSKIFTIGCCADSVAKPTLMNMKQFNGEHGCPYCYHPGDSTENGGNCKKYLPVDYPERTNVKFRKDMVDAEYRKTEVKGVKGIGPFYTIDYFNCSWGFCIDYMHSSLIGCMKFMHSLWFDSTNHDKPYYLDQGKMLLVDAKLTALRPPTDISRPPRSLSEQIHWKANEWRSHMLYYSYLCLDGILDDKYLAHFCLFISAMYLLLQEKISVSELREADTLLQEFVLRFKDLYGEENMRFNVHLCKHLARAVAFWGPLWTSSAFSFESGNGIFLKLVKGTRGVIEQVASKSILYSNLSLIISTSSICESEALDFCDEIMSHRRLKKAVYCKEAVVCGRFKRSIFTNVEKVALAAFGVTNARLARRCQKIIYNSKMYALDKYLTHGKKTKRNDSVVVLKSGHYCQILSFFQNPQDPESLLFFGKKMKLVRNAWNSNFATKGNVCIYNIKPCDIYPYDDLAVFRITDIKRKCILLEINDRLFLSEFPNCFEKD